MFRPIGSLPPAVYWRRRLVLIGSGVVLLALIVITARVVFSGDSGSGSGGKAAGATTGRPTPRTSAPSRPALRSGASRTPSMPASSPTSVASSSASSVSSSSSAASSAVSSSGPPPQKCDIAKLKLAAQSDRTSYSIGQKPVLSVLVTNPTTQPCVQDLGDRQILLRVFNGESRVWGSHDCKIVPGVDDRTLAAGSTVRLMITWTGLSSEPRCAGTRQQVGAGTYTVYASLAGREASAAQFTIS